MKPRENQESYSEAIQSTSYLRNVNAPYPARSSRAWEKAKTFLLDVAHVGWTVLRSFSRPTRGRIWPRRGAAAGGGTNANVVMKIYGPNCVALVEFFLASAREREAVWFGLG